MNVGGPEALVALTAGIFPLVCLVVTIVALVDVVGRPGWVWQQAGDNRALWLVLLIIGLPFCLIGLIVGLIYLFTVRPRLAAVQQAQGSPGGYGYGGPPIYPPGSTPPVPPSWAPPPPAPPGPGTGTGP